MSDRLPGPGTDPGTGFGTGAEGADWQDDLAQAAAQEHAEVLADAAAIAEAARGRTHLADRLRASRGVLNVHCLGGVVATGEVGAVAAAVVELTDGATVWLLAPDAITMVTDLPAVLPPHEPAPAARVPLTWGMALRPWTGEPVTVHLRDSAQTHGRLGSVGADHLDVQTGTGAITVPFTAIAAVRCG